MNIRCFNRRKEPPGCTLYRRTARTIEGVWVESLRSDRARRLHCLDFSMWVDRDGRPRFRRGSVCGKNPSGWRQRVSAQRRIRSKRLGGKVHRRFQEFGADGAAAAELAAAVPAAGTSPEITSNPTVQQDASSHPGPQVEKESGVRVASEESGLAEVVKATIGTSDSGSGSVLPLVALIVVLAMAVARFSRRHRSEQQGSEETQG